MVRGLLQNPSATVDANATDVYAHPQWSTMVTHEITVYENQAYRVGYSALVNIHDTGRTRAYKRDNQQ